MKRTLLFLTITLCSISFCISQSWSTGTVSLDTDFTVQFDVNSGTGLVTMTMVGPSNRWLGVGPGITTGNMMGNAGDDAIVFNSVGLQDRNMLAGNGMPNLDASQDWTLTSNTTLGAARTIVATRAINTGDPNDFVFPTAAGPLPILWAKGGALGFGYHTGGRGGTVANLVLGVNDSKLDNDFTLAPNPASTNFIIELPSNISDANVEIYNLLGKQVYERKVSDSNGNVDVSNWKSGVYLVKVSSGIYFQTKRFIKQ